MPSGETAAAQSAAAARAARLESVQTKVATAKPVLIGTAVVGATTMVFGIIMMLQEHYQAVDAKFNVLEKLSLVHPEALMGLLLPGRIGRSVREICGVPVLVAVAVWQTRIIAWPRRPAPSPAARFPSTTAFPATTRMKRRVPPRSGAARNPFIWRPCCCQPPPVRRHARSMPSAAIPTI